MSKVTSKLQVTIPKAVAQKYGIEPGDEIEWVAAGDVIRVLPAAVRETADIESRLSFFDQATDRQKQREGKQPVHPTADRGWTREELYERGRSS